jgi:hypothetical protein
MTIAPAKDFVSIGTLASQLRVTVRSIENTADRLHISPALRINLIPHFDGTQCEQIASAVRATGSTTKEQNR